MNKCPSWVRVLLPILVTVALIASFWAVLYKQQAKLWESYYDRRASQLVHTRDALSKCRYEVRQKGVYDDFITKGPLGETFKVCVDECRDLVAKHRLRRLSPRGVR